MGILRTPLLIIGIMNTIINAKHAKIVTRRILLN